jgi:hypothetical protein
MLRIGEVESTNLNRLSSPAKSNILAGDERRGDKHYLQNFQKTHYHKGISDGFKVNLLTPQI